MAAAATESKLLKRDSMMNDIEDLDPGTLSKVNDSSKASSSPICLSDYGAP